MLVGEVQDCQEAQCRTHQTITFLEVFVKATKRHLLFHAGVDLGLDELLGLADRGISLGSPSFVFSLQVYHYSLLHLHLHPCLHLLSAAYVAILADFFVSAEQSLDIEAYLTILYAVCVLICWYFQIFQQPLELGLFLLTGVEDFILPTYPHSIASVQKINANFHNRLFLSRLSLLQLVVLPFLHQISLLPFCLIGFSQLLQDEVIGVPLLIHLDVA